MKKLFIITGEYSGEKHACDIVKELQKNGSEFEIEAIGGSNLEKLGISLFANHEKMNSVGISPKILIDHINLGKNLIKHLEKFQPDIVLMIDYGGFNLNIAKIIKKTIKTKIFYYIPPQIWASRKHRLNAVESYIDRVFCIFPFEKEMYKELDIPCTYVGHPLVYQIPRSFNRKEFFNKYELNINKPLVSIFPGSRIFEIKNLLKMFIQAKEKIKNELPEVQFVLALAPNLNPDILKKYMPKNSNIKILQNENYNLLALSDSLILASGTVALEAALYKTPMLISYRGPYLFYLIYLMVRCIKMVSLPNIISGKYVIKELLQWKATANSISKETIKILRDEEYRAQMIEELSKVEEKLSKHNPAKEVAEAIRTELLK